MLGKDELIKSLQEINDKRLLSSEVTALLDPFKEVTFPINLEFISHSRTFGKQDNSIYNGGQTGIFKIADLNVECAVLLTPDDNDMIEEQKPGSRSEFIVSYLDYDSLYKRVIMGKAGPLTSEDEKVTDELSPSSENQGSNEPGIETAQRSESITQKVNKREQSPPLRSKKKKGFRFSKKKKRELSFSKSTASLGAAQKRAWLAKLAEQEDIKERKFKNAIAPILIGVGIIFCLTGYSILLPDGEGIGSLFIGISLLLAGISLRIHKKRG